MKDLRKQLGMIVGELYLKYGGTEEVLRLSNILNTLVLLEQREIYKRNY